MLLNPYDRDALREQYTRAEPFPFFKIDNFLDPAFAEEVVRAYPSYATARGAGTEFSALNERRKVQVNDSSRFPQPVKLLSDALASPEFLADISHITGIPRLVPDERLEGGGMHITGPGG